jgi:hypothetical protein
MVTGNSQLLRQALRDAHGVRAEFKTAEARPLHSRVNLSEDR